MGDREGTISVDGDELRIEPTDVPGTRDRSWGMRNVGTALETNWPRRRPQAFWLWAPLHFADRFTHLALHEYPDGSRWLETSLVLDPVPDGLQNLVIARMGDRTGVGVLEQAHFGPHMPTGLTGFLDGFGS